MLDPLARRRLVVVLTGILAIAPIGVALARIGGLPLRSGDSQTTGDRSFSVVNRRAVLDLSASQYGDSRGRFDLALPGSTGPETALPKESYASWNSLRSLDSVGYATGNHVFGSQAQAFTGGVSSLLRPRRGSASFATSAVGMAGVGAWGGVSGTAARRPFVLITPRAARILAAATTNTPRPPRAAAPPRRNGSGGGSSNGNSSSGGSSGGDSAPADSVVDPGEIAGSADVPVVAAAAPPADPVGTAGSLGAGGSANAPGSPASPAGAPEPISLVLMGSGLAGLYRARRYLA